jgi:hypothetical protein
MCLRPNRFSRGVGGGDGLILNLSDVVIRHRSAEGLSRIPLAFVTHPGEGRPWIYCIRLLASLLILVAILKKNYGKD